MSAIGAYLIRLQFPLLIYSGVMRRLPWLRGQHEGLGVCAGWPLQHVIAFLEIAPPGHGIHPIQLCWLRLFQSARPTVTLPPLNVF